MRSTYTEKLKARAQTRRKIFYLAGLLVFLTFMATALFGERGILVNMRINAEYNRLRAERDHLQAENRRLVDEIRALKENSRAIEALGRREFGFGRPGEIVFYFPDQGGKAVERYDIPAKANGRGSP